MNAKEALKKKDRILPGLRDDERVLAQTVISNGIYWKAVGVLLLAVILLLFAWQLTVFMLVVAGLTALFTYVKKQYLFLAVTNQRVLVKSGILLTDMVQLQYSRIESVETQTSLLGRSLDYSALIVSGTGSQFTFIPYVENAEEVQRVINEILQQRDVSSGEYLQRQAKVQAEALAEVLEDQKKT